PEVEFPRSETVFTTGAEWGTYSNWNPLHSGGQATYVRQGIYETLFVFDPWTTELEPWLAADGEWVSDDEYVLRLREGVRWHDGEPLTAEDVVFTVNLRDAPGVPYAPLRDWLDEVVADDEYVLRLREDVRWHDGEPLTAEDVVFTVNLRDAPGVPYAPLSDWLDEVVAEDDLTVRFTFSDLRAGEWDNWLYNHHIL